MTESELNLIKSNPEPNIKISLRWLGRVPRQSDRYLGFLIRDEDPVKFDENNEDPVTYMDAMHVGNRSRVSGLDLEKEGKILKLFQDHTTED